MLAMGTKWNRRKRSMSLSQMMESKRITQNRSRERDKLMAVSTTKAAAAMSMHRCNQCLKIKFIAISDYPVGVIKNYRGVGLID